MGDVPANTPVVLVLTTGRTAPEGLDGRFSTEHDAMIAVTDSIGVLDTELDGDATIACVVVTEFVADPEEIVEHCRDADPDLPVVVAAGDLELAPALTAHGNVVFLGEQWDGSRLRECVGDALSAYDRRQELREDATIMRSYLRGLRNSLFVKDEEGNHVRLSHFPGGIGPEDVSGGSSTVLSEQSTRNGTEELERAVIEEGDHVYSQDQRVYAESGTHWLRTSKVPWYDENGDIRGLVGLSWDVTDEMRVAQELDAVEESFESFAKSLSHDVRTPLEVARGNIQLANDTQDRAPLEKADSALDRIGEMIEDLETVTRQQEVSLLSENGAEDAESAIDRTRLAEVAESVWSVLDTDGATLSIEFSASATILARESSLRPLFENLFRNAIVHGGDDVGIRLGRVETGGFFVADDGPGIPPDQRGEVLQEGFTTSANGSGTGLSIVEDIANAHSWEVEIANGATGGARIEIRNCMLVDGEPAPCSTGQSVELDASEDVGPVETAGKSEYDDGNDRWTVRGAGTNIWRRVNEFHFAHTAVERPLRITAKVVDVEEWSQYTKAGVMVRDSLEESATYGYVGVTPNHGTEVLWRSTTDDVGRSQHLGETSLSLPWYRLDLREDTLSAAVSADGEEWHSLDQRTVSLDGDVLAGLAVCSHMPQRLCEATFESVRVERLEP